MKVFSAFRSRFPEPTSRKRKFTGLLSKSRRSRCGGLDRRSDGCQTVVESTERFIIFEALAAAWLCPRSGEDPASIESPARKAAGKTAALPSLPQCVRRRINVQWNRDWWGIGLSAALHSL